MRQLPRFFVAKLNEQVVSLAQLVRKLRWYFSSLPSVSVGRGGGWLPKHSAHEVATCVSTYGAFGGKIGREEFAFGGLGFRFGLRLSFAAHTLSISRDS